MRAAAKVTPRMFCTLGTRSIAGNLRNLGGLGGGLGFDEAAGGNAVGADLAARAAARSRRSARLPRGAFVGGGMNRMGGAFPIVDSDGMGKLGGASTAAAASHTCRFGTGIRDEINFVVVTSVMVWTVVVVEMATSSASCGGEEIGVDERLHTSSPFGMPVGNGDGTGSGRNGGEGGGETAYDSTLV